MVDGGKFIAGEAVFYINSISEIKDHTGKQHTSGRSQYHLFIKTGEYQKTGRTLTKDGHEVQNRGYTTKKNHTKMFTFCASTVYIGADFYSTNAYSYIFANPRISSMTVDVSVDLQQIIGRQRLEENPFRNSATLYFNTKESRWDRQTLIKRSGKEELRPKGKLRTMRSSPIRMKCSK